MATALSQALAYRRTAGTIAVYRQPVVVPTAIIAAAAVSSATAAVVAAVAAATNRWTSLGPPADLSPVGLVRLVGHAAAAAARAAAAPPAGAGALVAREDGGTVPYLAVAPAAEEVAENYELVVDTRGARVEGVGGVVAPDVAPVRPVG